MAKKITKETVEESVAFVKETAQNTKDKVVEAAKDTKDKVTESAKDKTEKVLEEAKKATDKASTKAKEAKAVAKKATSSAKEVTTKAASAAKKTAVKEYTKLALKETYIQFYGEEYKQSEILEKIEAAFVEQGHRVSTIKELKLYIKPEEKAAYYVINDKFTGYVPL